MNLEAAVVDAGSTDLPGGKAGVPKRDRWISSLLWSAGAIGAFHLAYGFSELSFLIFGYLFCLLELAGAATGRQAFYSGLGIGLLTAAPQLSCFWVIFGPGAIALWLVLAFWVGLFVALARLCRVRFGPVFGGLLAPFLWTGLEYFRSELYYLRFSWLNIGYALSPSALLPFCKWFGMYGVGFLGMAVVAALLLFRPKRAALLAIRLAVLGIVVLFLQAYGEREKSLLGQGNSVVVGGVQLEFQTEAEVLLALDKLIEAAPETELLVLSEYTYDGPVPEKILAWCLEHKRYLVVGGKAEAPGANFYDTAFVVAPTGEIVFRQGKSVPIQFFKDGLPAKAQRIWESPWGKIGICVCYDLSYTRVTDALIRLGAQAIIVPTMDVVDWGRHQHELHARVAPMRAAEYGVPIFRVASSGISQLIDASGRTVARAGFPGPGAMLWGRMALGQAGVLPVDRWLGPLAVGASAIIIFSLMARRSIRFGVPPSGGATSEPPKGGTPNPGCDS